MRCSTSSRLRASGPPGSSLPTSIGISTRVPLFVDLKRRAASSPPICTPPAAVRWSPGVDRRGRRSTLGANRHRPLACREAADAVETPGQQVFGVEAPIKKSGGLVILHGSLAPEARS